jgi:hypothetical protein
MEEEKQNKVPEKMVDICVQCGFWNILSDDGE